MIRNVFITVVLIGIVVFSLSTGITTRAAPSDASASPHADWQIQYWAPDGITLRGIKMLNTQVGYAVGGPDWGYSGNPYVLKTTNGGVDWKRLAVPDVVGGWQGGIDCLDEQRCISVGTTGQATRTSDGGATWTVRGVNQNYGGYLYSAHYATDQIVLAGGTDGKSYRSANGGQNWTEFFPGGSVVVWEFKCFGATCYGSGNGASFVFSTDQGVSWSRRFAPADDLLGMSFLDVNTGWVAGSTGSIYYTNNAGNSWTTQLHGTYPNELYYTSFYDIEMLNSSEGWAVGGVSDQHGRIYHTGNGGSTWEKVTMPSTGFVWEVDFVDANHGWAVTHDGKILSYGGPAGNTPTVTPTPLPSGTVTETPTGNPTETPTATPTFGPTGTSTPTATNGPTGTATPTRTATATRTSTPTLTPTPAEGSWKLQWHANEELNDIDFVDQQRGWAVGENGHRVRTTDGGLTWSFQRGTPSDDIESVNFVNPTTGWTAGENGNISISTNGGNSWAKQTAPTTSHLYEISMSDPTNGWVVGATGTILRTTNAGADWSPQTSGTAQNLYTGFAWDNTHAWAAGAAGTLIATTNGGNSWAAQASLIPANVAINDIAFTSPENGWAVADQGYVVQTTDGGARWRVRGGFGSNDLRGVSFSSPQVGWIVGKNGGVWSTTNGGDSWQQTPNLQQSFIAVSAPVNGEAWLIAPGHQILHNPGTGNFSVSAPYGVTEYKAVDSVDSTTAYVVGEDASILKTTNGGASWRWLPSQALDVDGQGPAWLRGVKFPENGQTGWVAGRFGLVLKTTDGGESWRREFVKDGNGDVHTGFLWFVEGYDNDHVMTGGKEGYVFRTNNGGNNWLFSQAGMAINIRDASFATHDIVYGATVYDSFVTSTNGGATWVRTYPGNNNDLWYQGVDFKSANVGWIVANMGTIFKTTDGGNSWTRQTSNTNLDLNNVSFSDINEGWVVGAAGTIRHTTNSGATWNEQTSPTTAELKWIDMVNSNHGWAVGENGTIIKYDVPPPAPTATPTPTATPSPTATPTATATPVPVYKFWFPNFRK